MSEPKIRKVTINAVNCYLVTNKNGSNMACYEGNGDYEAIEYFQATIEQLRQEREWISVEDRLPEKEEFRILVRLQNGLVVIASYLDNSGTKFPWEGWRYEGMHPANYKFTDWMPLPDATEG